MKRSGASAGYTLIELLVALALVALLATVLLSGIRQGARSWEAVQSVSDRTANVVNTQSLLRRQLAQLGELDPANGKRLAFAGTEKQIAFDAAWQADLPVTSIHRIRIAPETRPDGTLDLVYRWAPAGEGAGTLAGSRTLLSGVDALRWRYFGDPDGGRGGGWHGTWPADARSTPRLVALDIRFADPRRRFPPFVARIP